MLKTYDELRKIDVSQYCEYRKEGEGKNEKKIPYLNWAKCIELLHENGAEEVFFEPIPQEGGTSLIKSDCVFADTSGKTNRVYETRIKITIDNWKFEFQGPVMNGANPVKDNSMSQQRLWNCQCRLFVKAVAIYTGLGFDLWLKAEEQERSQQKESDFEHDIRKVKDRVYETITAIQKKSNDMTMDQIAEKLNRSKEELQSYLAMYNTLYAFEHNLICILKKLDDNK